MIKLTKLNHEIIYLNPLMIESIEITPDTVIVLTNGKTMVVSNTIDYIINEVVNFYSKFKIFPMGFYSDK